jgi:hypothetical protein
VSREGGEVNVSITDDAPYPLNADCTTYCDRLEECWAELPGADVMVSDEEARGRCVAEREGCHTATTQTLCCGYVKDCNAFAQCQAKSRDRVTACQRGG